MTLAATQLDPTAEVLAGMLTEPTGTHFLDSGGAYGRNWERNQGRTLEAFEESSSVTFDGYDDDVWPVVSVFHFLNSRLEFDPTMQRRFELWVALRDEPNDPWLVEAEAFAEAWDDGTGYDGPPRGWNSYNGESFLSQVIQYVTFSRDGETYAALQIHGGCDVRGGYTAPKMFRVLGESYALAYESVSAGHAARPPAVAVQATLEGGEVTILEGGGCPLGEFAIDYTPGETRVYIHESGSDLYGEDMRPYLPVWRDGHAVCNSCGVEIVGDLLDC